MPDRTPAKAGPRRCRLEVRISEEQDRLVRRAAALSGETVSAFVLQTVAERAEAVIADSEDLVLSSAAYDRFLEELDRPPEVVPELAALFTKHPPVPD